MVETIDKIIIDSCDSICNYKEQIYLVMPLHMFYDFYTKWNVWCWYINFYSAERYKNVLIIVER